MDLLQLRILINNLLIKARTGISGRLTIRKTDESGSLAPSCFTVSEYGLTGLFTACAGLSYLEAGFSLVAWGEVLFCSTLWRTIEMLDAARLPTRLTAEAG